MSLMKHLKYLWYVIRHKWFVFHEGRALGLGFWQAFCHDWSKFLPDEWIPYVNYFYGDSDDIHRRCDDIAFDMAWLKHQHRNPHHWQWWVLIQDEGDIKVLPMTDKYRREMLADWRGAGKAQGTPDTLAWYCENKHKIKLHPDTRRWVEQQLGLRLDNHE